MLHQGKQSILPSHSRDQDLSEIFNKFFINKFADIRARLDAATLHQPDLSQVHLNRVHHSADRNQPRLDSFYPASESEIHRIIFTSPPTSCSSDPVPTWLLKKHRDIILPFITLIVNKSLEDGIFPDSFKQAVVVPLLKKPNLDQGVLKNRLQEYLNHHGLTEPLQSAYKKHHSTETALVQVHNDILLALDSKKAVFLVLLDLI